MIRWIAAGAALLVVCVVAAVYWALQPREDYSTPRAATETFYVALMTGDVEMARRGVADPAQADLLAELHNLIAVVLEAQEAARTRFGESASTISAGLPSLDDIQTAEERVDGTQATLAPRNPKVRPARLARIGQQWRVDLFATFDIDPARAKMGRQILQAAAQSVKTEVQTIKAGGYKSSDEVNTALRASIDRSVMQAAIGTVLQGILK